MKINEVEQLNEGVGDWMRAAAYNTLGIGGDRGNMAANMYKFIDNFKQQIGQSQRAAKSSGMPLDYNQIIDSYLNKYNWYANPQQKEKLLTMTNDPTKLAKAMYSIGVNQFRDKSGAVNDPRAGQASAATNNGRAEPAVTRKSKKMAATAAAQQPEYSGTSEQVMATIQKLKGAENLDDLAAITKTAMQTLYGQNKEKYTELYKEITTGTKAVGPADIAARRAEKLKAASAAADASSAEIAAKAAEKAQAPTKAVDPYADDDNPNVYRGMNESKRR